MWFFRKKNVSMDYAVEVQRMNDSLQEQLRIALVQEKALRKALVNLLYNVGDCLTPVNQKIVDCPAGVSALMALNYKPLKQNKQIWKHYKGGLYEFIDFAYREGDCETMAVYKSLDSGIIWIRPFSKFQKRFKMIRCE